MVTQQKKDGTTNLPIVPDANKSVGANQVIDVNGGSGSSQNYPAHVIEFQKKVKNMGNQIFAFTGSAFNELYVQVEPNRDLLEMMLKGQIFARMKPNHKSVLV